MYMRVIMPAQVCTFAGVYVFALTDAHIMCDYDNAVMHIYNIAYAWPDMCDIASTSLHTCNIAYTCAN